MRVSEGFDLQQGGEHAPVSVLKLPNVIDRDAGRRLAAKKELEQELIAGRVVLEGQGQPLAQAGAAGIGQGVLLAPLPGLGAGAAGDDQALGSQPLQGRIDLAVALAPDVADAGFDGLAQIVTGLVGLDGEQAEEDVGGSIPGHIAARYI